MDAKIQHVAIAQTHPEKGWRVASTFGAKMILPRQSRTSTEIYVTKANMDWGSEAIFARFADPERDFLDIGSHIGYYAAYLAPRVRCAYAFESDPRNVPALQQNARLTKNIQVT